MTYRDNINIATGARFTTREYVEKYTCVFCGSADGTCRIATVVGEQVVEQVVHDRCYNRRQRNIARVLAEREGRGAQRRYWWRRLTWSGDWSGENWEQIEREEDV